MTLRILPMKEADREWTRSMITREWRSDLVVVHQEIFHPHLLPGLKAMDGDETTGLITYKITGNNCEIITLNSFHAHKGVGTALIQAVEETALVQNCLTCSLVTTNNNRNAIDFYQKRGYCITKVDRGAVDLSRKIKPSIPLLDENGTPITDEITLEKKIC
jgi:GNAT superfamily N-acetyltransferase